MKRSNGILNLLGKKIYLFFTQTALLKFVTQKTNGNLEVALQFNDHLVSFLMEIQKYFSTSQFCIRFIVDDIGFHSSSIEFFSQFVTYEWMTTRLQKELAHFRPFLDVPLDFQRMAVVMPTESGKIRWDEVRIQKTCGEEVTSKQIILVSRDILQTPCGINITCGNSGKLYVENRQEIQTVLDENPDAEIKAFVDIDGTAYKQIESLLTNQTVINPEIATFLQELNSKPHTKSFVFLTSRMSKQFCIQQNTDQIGNLTAKINECIARPRTPQIDSEIKQYLELIRNLKSKNQYFEYYHLYNPGSPLNIQKKFLKAKIFIDMNTNLFLGNIKIQKWNFLAKQAENARLNHRKMIAFFFDDDPAEIEMAKISAKELKETRSNFQLFVIQVYTDGALEHGASNKVVSYLENLEKALTKNVIKTIVPCKQKLFSPGLFIKEETPCQFLYRLSGCTLL